MLTANGVYNATPDSYSYQWYFSDGSLVDGGALDAILLYDKYAGSAVKLGEVAHKASYIDSDINYSALSSAIALIDPTVNQLTNAITDFHRVSLSGVTPMTWSLTFGSNVYAGYMLRMETFSSGSLLDAAHRTVDFHYPLTDGDLQSGAALRATLLAAGWTDPGATEFVRPTVYTTSPNGLGYQYVGPVISPTDATVAMTWSTTDRHDQGSGSYSYSNGNLTFTCGSGTPYTVRGNRAVAFDFTYWEATTGAAELGVADDSLDMSIIPGATVEGQTPTTNAGVWAGKYGSSYLSYNGSETTVGNAFSNDTDIIQIALDRPAKKIWFAKNGAGLADGTGWLNGNPVTGTGGLAMPSIGAMKPYLQLGYVRYCTANFGTTPGSAAGFSYSPPTNGTTRVFVAP
jgi:hypothetical protein